MEAREEEESTVLLTSQMLMAIRMTTADLANRNNLIIMLS